MKITFSSYLLVSIVKLSQYKIVWHSLKTSYTKSTYSVNFCRKYIAVVLSLDKKIPTGFSKVQFW